MRTFTYWKSCLLFWVVHIQAHSSVHCDPSKHSVKLRRWCSKIKSPTTAMLEQWRVRKKTWSGLLQVEYVTVVHLDYSGGNCALRNLRKYSPIKMSSQIYSTKKMTFTFSSSWSANLSAFFTYSKMKNLTTMSDRQILKTVTFNYWQCPTGMFKSAEIVSNEVIWRQT